MLFDIYKCSFIELRLILSNFRFESEKSFSLIQKYNFYNISAKGNIFRDYFANKFLDAKIQYLMIIKMKKKVSVLMKIYIINVLHTHSYIHW